MLIIHVHIFSTTVNPVFNGHLNIPDLDLLNVLRSPFNTLNIPEKVSLDVCDRYPFMAGSLTWGLDLLKRFTTTFLHTQLLAKLGR